MIIEINNTSFLKEIDLLCKEGGFIYIYILNTGINHISRVGTTIQSIFDVLVRFKYIHRNCVLKGGMYREEPKDPNCLSYVVKLLPNVPIPASGRLELILS